MGYAQETVFLARNGPRMYELEGTIENCKQEGAVVDYFGKLTKMWDELAHYEKVLECCCGNLTCTRIIDSERQREKKRLHNFLLSLNPSFRAIISQILNMNPLLSFDTAYNMIICEERHVVIVRNQDARSKAVVFPPVFLT